MYISVGPNRCLLVSRKENLTGVLTGLTGRLKNLEPTGFHLWAIGWVELHIIDELSFDHLFSFQIIAIVISNGRQIGLISYSKNICW